MTKIFSGLFNHADRMQMESLSQRLTKSEVIGANIANAETPGFRALGYDFEQQLQALDNKDEPFQLLTTSPKHYTNEYTEADGTIYPDVYVVPSESFGQDGNTVDVDAEMAKLSENHLLYQTVTEILNRKIGTLRYAITSGGR